MQNTLTEYAGKNKDTLHNNLVALEKHHPHIYRMVEPLLDTVSIRLDPQETLYITRNGQQIIISKQRRDAVLATVVIPEIREPVHLLVGLGVADELLATYRNTEAPRPELPSYKLPIYILEPEPLMLIAAMWLHNLMPQLNSGRVQLFLGVNASDELLEYLESNHQSQYPTHSLSMWYPNDHPVVHNTFDGIKQLIDRTNAAVYKLETDINDYYKKFTNNDWHEVFTSRTRPLRVMGCTSRFTSFLQYCVRDLISGFERLGHQALIHIEESDISRATKYDILSTILYFKPDLIIHLDHFRDEWPYLPANVPFVNWIQDMLPNITKPDARILHPLDFTYVFAPGWLNKLKSMPMYAKHPINVLTLGINPDIYHPISNTTKDIDLLYVSHLVSVANTLRPLVDTLKNFDIDDKEIELLDTGAISYEQLLVVYMLMTKTFDNLLIDDLWKYVGNNQVRRSLVTRTLATAGIEENDIVVEHFFNSRRIHNDIYYAIKTRPLKTLAKQGVNLQIYGKHWDQDRELSRFSHGPIDNGEPLNMLMNQSRICLNNSPGTSLHMRSVEIMASGCFMLSREIEPDTSSIREYFDDQDGLGFFKNEIDIGPITKYWLAQDNLDKISAPAHKKALALFDYKVITQTIIDNVSARCKNTQ
ncbi:MAG: glycosyltransferase [Gammaproteobacteria bacterium]|nr:glycosyltransferase [Gammaproteobacteria bacterium]